MYAKLSAPRAMYPSLSHCLYKCHTLAKCVLSGDDGRCRGATPTLGRSGARALAFWGGRKGPHPCDQQEEPIDGCASRTCNAKPKVGWFDWLFKRKKEAPAASRRLPDVRCCRKRYCRELQHPGPDPDFSEFGGQAYKTCGIAYVIQRDRTQPTLFSESKEDKLLRQIETHPDLQSRMLHEDPVKESDNLFNRLVEMSDLGLHPLYKKIAATPLKEGPGVCKHVRPYRTLTGPLDHSHLPAQITVNLSHLEKKNIYWVHKQVTPPRDLEGRIMETKPRLKLTDRSFEACREKPQVFDVDRCTHAKRETVYDSLQQRPMDFTGVCKDDDRDRSEIIYHPTV